MHKAIDHSNALGDLAILPVLLLFTFLWRKRRLEVEGVGRAGK